MHTPLGSEFFNRHTVDVAKELLGKKLMVHHTAHIITETEAYHGQDDQACHARVGKTNRTAPMFGPPGHRYVYLIYGMYRMLNIVTGPQEFPSAVLIRGIHGYDGPGKLTKQLDIDNRFNAQPANMGTGLRIADNKRIADTYITQTKRIGVAYAGSCAQKPRRFIINTHNMTISTK